MNRLIRRISIIINIIRFKINRIKAGKHLRVSGTIGIVNKGYCCIGNDFICSSGDFTNPMGRNVSSFIYIEKNAKLIIGNNSGISSAVLRCGQNIKIGDNVKIGAMTIITDTDAHSLNPILRANVKTDAINAIKRPINIKDNVFIGTSCIICKGVTIGENSIIAAGSVVTHNIPDNEIWGGNPAKFIRTI